jgi:arthrofactin-type cyclic lipopeptide synthetase C
LAQKIDSEIPVYGLPGIATQKTQLRTVQALATRMIGMIRAVQPTGPYRIVGWSFGGILAYEIAAQLIGADEAIEFVGLLDTVYLAERERASTITDEKEYLLSEARRLYVAHPIPVRLHLFSAQEERDGDSLLGWDAVVPKAQITRNTAVGTHHSMLQEPHLASLGAAISRAIGTSKVAVAEEYDPVVVLGSASRSAAPLFCVPGAGANIGTFAALAGAIGDARTIYGLQPRGLDGLSVPHTTVAAAAALNAKAIDRICPSGPLHLLGHSFGGWVAFEMAQRLAAAGRAIASLTIVDSEVPGDPHATIDYDDIAATTNLIEVFEQIAERTLGISTAELESREESQRRELLHQSLVNVGILPVRSAPDILRGPMQVFARCLRTQYTPATIYPGPVRMVLLRDPRLDDAGNRRFHEQCVKGWKRWAPNSTVWHGPGNHMTAFDPPHVQIVADWLQRNLQASTEGSRGQ